MKFQQAIYFTLRHEGGTNYSAYDRGGLTKFGISQKQYPDLDIGSLSREEAIEIYREDYWEACLCDTLPQPIATVVFDSAVNCGPSSAIFWLQKSLSTVTVDGLIGPKTVAAAQISDPYKIAGGMAGYRLLRYSKLVNRNPAQDRFILGWVIRVSELLRFI